MPGIFDNPQVQALIRSLGGGGGKGGGQSGTFGNIPRPPQRQPAPPGAFSMPWSGGGGGKGGGKGGILGQLPVLRESEGGMPEPMGGGTEPIQGAGSTIEDTRKAELMERRAKAMRAMGASMTANSGPSAVRRMTGGIISEGFGAAGDSADGEMLFGGQQPALQTNDPEESPRAYQPVSPQMYNVRAPQESPALQRPRKLDGGGLF